MAIDHLTPLAVSITGEDLVTLAVVFFIGVCVVLALKWILGKM